jgi:hypothetical protein
MPELLVDSITSLDGWAAAEGWPGWWWLHGLGFGLGTAGCLVLGGIGLVASPVAFAAWSRKQIVRWGEAIRPLFPAPPPEEGPGDRLAG